MIENKKKQFEEVYEREADALFRFCLSRVSDREQAKDIVQESFGELWGAFVRGTEIEYERAFIFTVARNRIIDWYRKSKSSSLEAMMEAREGESPFEPRDEKADKKISFSAEARQILEAIEKLKPEHREVVRLRLVEELLPKEIAEVIGISPNAVSVRINRGIEEIRKILGLTEEL